MEEHAQIVNEIKEAESSLNKRLSLCVSPTIQSKSNSREQISIIDNTTDHHYYTADQSIKLEQSANKNNNSPHCRHPNDHDPNDDDALNTVSSSTILENDDTTTTRLEQVPQVRGDCSNQEPSIATNTNTTTDIGQQQ